MTESQLIAVIEDAALDGSWNAAAWLVERRWPERWSKRPTPAMRASMKAKDGDADPFAEIIDLAERRSG
ncbi:MAG: hypothetical protein J2P47_16135 [Acetobacteraceae bacterium]|nr:hypothetical protein [Acetobacteraceae bacterium]